jgi:phosphatidylinositol-bisphosphatase
MNELNPRIPPAGILVIVFVRTPLLPAVGEVVTDNVACGLLGMAGNKGGTAISFTLYRR